MAITNKEKHRLAFCISAVLLCAGFSLIATAITVSSAISPVALVFGFILTILSFCQARESYSFLENNKKPASKLINDIKNSISGEPKSELFIEKLFKPFIGIFSEVNQDRRER